MPFIRMNSDQRILLKILFLLFLCTLFAESTNLLPGSKCNSDADCQIYPNSLCPSTKTCACIAGYILIYNNQSNSSICVKLATKLNDTCQVQEQCHVTFGIDSTCSNGVCTCRNNGQIQYQPDQNYCYYGNVSLYGCKSNSDCGESECFSGFCKCRSDQILRVIDEKIGCYYVSDKKCSIHEQCQYSEMGFNSYCHKNQTCVCNDDSIQNKTSNVCVKKLGNPCRNNNECHYMTCNKEKCDCPVSKVLIQNDCYDKVALSGSCILNEQCLEIANHSVCIDKICKCKANSIEVNGSCYQEIHENCLNNDDCLHKTCSVTNTCECPTNTIYLKNDCLEKVSLNNICSLDEQCSAAINHSHCNAFCRCDSKFIQSNGYCYRGSETLGDTCTVQQQCSENLPNSECRDNKCRCKKEYHEKDKNCFKTSLYNEFCSVSENCYLINGICNGNKCECGNEDIFDSDTKLCIEQSSHWVLIICLVVVGVLIFLIPAFLYKRQIKNFFEKRYFTNTLRVR